MVKNMHFLELEKGSQSNFAKMGKTNTVTVGIG